MRCINWDIFIAIWNPIISWLTEMVTFVWPILDCQRRASSKITENLLRARYLSIYLSTAISLSTAIYLYIYSLLFFSFRFLFLPAVLAQWLAPFCQTVYTQCVECYCKTRELQEDANKGIFDGWLSWLHGSRVATGDWIWFYCRLVEFGTHGYIYIYYSELTPIINTPSVVDNIQ